MKTIAKILNYDDHRDSDKPNSISVTTLMGSMFKAKKYLDKTPKTHVTDLVLKRSSFIGTACHNRMEKILREDKKTHYDLEIFAEREVTVDGIVYTIAGSCDVLEKTDDKWILMDLKTGYGAARKDDMLKKDALQMSLYRWLNQDKYDIDDRAWTLWMSQSNNSIDEIPIQLMSLEQTQDFVENKLFAIAQNQKVDCREGVKYNTCNYCSYLCEHRN